MEPRRPWWWRGGVRRVLGRENWGVKVGCQIRYQVSICDRTEPSPSHYSIQPVRNGCKANSMLYIYHSLAVLYLKTS